jgi:hypothetical protein
VKPNLRSRAIHLNRQRRSLSKLNEIRNDMPCCSSQPRPQSTIRFNTGNLEDEEKPAREIIAVDEKGIEDVQEIDRMGEQFDLQ